MKEFYNRGPCPYSALYGPERNDGPSTSSLCPAEGCQSPGLSREMSLEMSLEHRPPLVTGTGNQGQAVMSLLCQPHVGLDAVMTTVSIYFFHHIPSQKFRSWLQEVQSNTRDPNHIVQQV